MLKRVVAAAVAALALGTGGTAFALPGGTINITNSSSQDMNLTANSFNSGGGVSTSFSPLIAAGMGGSGHADSLSSTTLSGTIIYQASNANAYGCSFSTLVFLSGSTYSFSFTKAAQGASPSPAVCNYTASRSASTGTFTGSASIAGF